mmetsp:Transcript_36302/g.113852  ORF Transcript_36302/g.113852 Transcript_36302/m.113852 type:complete len:390 (-) Transcript_36302:216-1385(-)
MMAGILPDEPRRSKKPGGITRCDSAADIIGNAVFMNDAALTHSKSLSSIGMLRENDKRIVTFGKRTGYASSVPLFRKDWEFLHHNEGPREFDNGVFYNPAGTQHTRFHTGFNRRGQSKIGQDKDRKEREHIKAVRSMQHSIARKRNLDWIDHRNEFNPISGAYNPKKLGTQYPESWEKPTFRDFGNLTFEQKCTARIQLRTSADRFYSAPFTGDHHDKRQHLQVTEGLLKPKMSSILANGKNDLPSYGVEDQFSKSDYTPKDPIKSHGLPELTAPGRYTPRKTGYFTKQQRMIGMLTIGSGSNAQFSLAASQSVPSLHAADTRPPAGKPTFATPTAEALPAIGGAPSSAPALGSLGKSASTPALSASGTMAARREMEQLAADIEAVRDL